MHSQRIAVFAFCFTALLVSFTTADAQQILPVTAHGWPDERTSNQQPPLAVDGNLGTYTWTTESFSRNHPAYLGLDFGSTYCLYRIRLWKDDDNGCGADASYNLVIQYTTGTGPLSGRAWNTVTNLQTGFAGETLQATAVNTNGTVSGESHDSVNEGHGWASLTFDPVEATGVRISFTSASCQFNHYKVHEFEAYFDSSSHNCIVPVEATTWGRIKSLYGN